MNVTIGSAPDSWGVCFGDDPKQPPWQRFLDEVAEAGYEWAELGPYSYLPTDVPTLNAELAKRGLKTSGTFTIFVEYLSAIRDTGFAGTVSLALEFSPDPAGMLAWVQEAHGNTLRLLREVGVH